MLRGTKFDSQTFPRPTWSLLSYITPAANCSDNTLLLGSSGHGIFLFRKMIGRSARKNDERSYINVFHFILNIALFCCPSLYWVITENLYIKYLLQFLQKPALKHLFFYFMTSIVTSTDVISLYLFFRPCPQPGILKFLDLTYLSGYPWGNVA